jgi:hypothetical protein
MNHSKPFAWDVDVEFDPRSGKKIETFHWRGCSENAAKRKGMLKDHALRILEIRPLSEDVWRRAYGLGNENVRSER